MLVIVVTLVGLAILGLQNGTIDVREVVVTFICWAPPMAIAVVVIKS